MVERESDAGELKEENEREEEEEEEEKDVEKGELGFEEKVIEINNQRNFQLSKMQRLNPTNPLRIVLNGGTRVATPPSHFSQPPPPPHPSNFAQPRSTPTPQVSSSFRLNKIITLFVYDNFFI